MDLLKLLVDYTKPLVMANYMEKYRYLFLNRVVVYVLSQRSLSLNILNKANNGIPYWLERDEYEILGERWSGKRKPSGAGQRRPASPPTQGGRWSSSTVYLRTTTSTSTVNPGRRWGMEESETLAGARLIGGSCQKISREPTRCSTSTPMFLPTLQRASLP